MSKRQRLALLATIIGSGVVFLDGSVVSLALVKIAASLHANFASMQWLVDGYALSLAALILLGGSLGDIFGRKRVYLVGLAGFAVVSFLCGLSPNMPILIVLRVIQGVFGAMLVPGALAIINTNFPKELRGSAIGQWTAAGGIAAAVGPLVGGYVLDRFSWHWIFFINVPIIAVSFILAWIGIVETKDEQPRRVDGVGAALAALGLAGLTYGLIEGPVRHWNPLTTSLLVLGVAMMAGFVWFESKHRDPMLNLSLFKSANFTAANTSTFAMYGALGGFFFALAIHLQQVVGFSPLKAGSSLLPVTFLMLFLSTSAGKWSGKYGPRWFMTAGPLLAAVGMLYLLPLGHGANYLVNIFPGVVIFGIGLALTVAPLTTTVMSSVRQVDSGIASAVNNAVSRVAGLLVVAVLGILGAGQAYHFAAILCVGMAAGAGILSLVFVKNPDVAKTPN